MIHSENDTLKKRTLKIQEQESRNRMDVFIQIEKSVLLLEVDTDKRARNEKISLIRNSCSCVLQSAKVEGDQNICFLIYLLLHLTAFCLFFSLFLIMSWKLSNLLDNSIIKIFLILFQMSHFDT